MAIYSIDYIKPSRMDHGLAHPIRKWPEKASQTYKKGAPLVNSGGYAKEASNAAHANILGIAVKDGGNTSSNGTSSAQFVPAIPTIEFVGVIGSHAASSAAKSLAASHRGLQWALYKSISTSVWYLDYAYKSSTASHAVVVTDFKEPVSTANGEVYFKFTEGVAITA